MLSRWRRGRGRLRSDRSEIRNLTQRRKDAKAQKDEEGSLIYILLFSSRLCVKICSPSALFLRSARSPGFDQVVALIEPRGVYASPMSSYASPISSYTSAISSYASAISSYASAISSYASAISSYASPSRQGSTLPGTRSINSPLSHALAAPRGCSLSARHHAVTQRCAIRAQERRRGLRAPPTAFSRQLRLGIGRRGVRRVPAFRLRKMRLLDERPPEQRSNEATEVSAVCASYPRRLRVLSARRAPSLAWSDHPGGSDRWADRAEWRGAGRRPASSARRPARPGFGGGARPAVSGGQDARDSGDEIR